MASALDHSTSFPADLRASLLSIARDSYSSFRIDVDDNHTWLDSFFDTLDSAKAKGNSRAVATDLLKTPGRKHATKTPFSVSASAQRAKDPVATLLFPPKQPAQLSTSTSGTVHDKENGGTLSPSPSQKRLYSLAPVGLSTSPSGSRRNLFGAPGSPLRGNASPVTGSPRLGFAVPVALNLEKATLVPSPAKSKEDVVMDGPAAEEDEPAAAGEMDVDQHAPDADDDEDVDLDEPVVAPEEETQANLSIIGEEEEEEEEPPAILPSPSPQKPINLNRSSLIILPEAQFSDNAPAPPSPTSPTLPSPKPVSAAYASLNDDFTIHHEASVPLNDAPSHLRNASGMSFGTTTPSSNTRTPSRFASFSTSANKTGSSPPLAGTTTPGYSLAGRPSAPTTAGRATLTFVGLPKKSFPNALGRSLGGPSSWTAAGEGSQGANSSFGSQPQPQSQSTQSQTQSTQATTAPALSGTNSLVNANANATGGVKRKSLGGQEPPAKRVDAVEEAAPISKVAMLKMRMSNLSRPSVARLSVAGGNGNGLLNFNATTSAAQLHATIPTPVVVAPQPPATQPPPKPRPQPACLPSVQSAPPTSQPVPAPQPATTWLPPPPTSIPRSPTPSRAPPPPISLPMSPSATGSLVRKSSVSDMVKSIEAMGSPARSMLPQSIFRSPSTRAKSPTPARNVATSPLRMNLRSPSIQRGFVLPELSVPAPAPTPVAVSAPVAAPAPTPVPAPAPAPEQEQEVQPLSEEVEMVVEEEIVVETQNEVVVERVEEREERIFDREKTPMATLSPKQKQAISTTPQDSPPTQNFPTFDNISQPVFDHIEADDEDSDEEDEETQIREVEDVLGVKDSFRYSDEEEDGEVEGDDEVDTAAVRSPSLPGPPEASDDEQEEDEEDVMVVDKGRGEVATAMEPRERDRVDDDAQMALRKAVRPSASTGLKPSPSKSIMPGTFGAEDSDGEGEVEMEDEEGEAEDEEAESAPTSKPATQNTRVSQIPTANSNGRTLNKKSSQSSLASTSTAVSTQSQNANSNASSTGMMSFLNKSFGNGATKKPDGKVKSIQLAAAAAKKEKEEKERKAALKAGREQKKVVPALQKQDEDRVKTDEELKARQEAVAKKRQEIQAATAANKAKLNKSASKKEEDAAKSRKIGQPEPKRPEIKKPPQLTRPVGPSSSSHLASSLNTSMGRSLNPPQQPQQQLKASAGASSMIGVKFMNPNLNAQAQAGPSAPRVVALNPSAQGKPGPSSSQQRPPQPKPEPEPYVELPDIDSEYSDSGDEDHAEKVAAYPQWVQSPITALTAQQFTNPDDVFGPIPPLSMRALFGNTSTRITKRSSSAHWEGTDALTTEEMIRYSRQMGYKPFK